MTRRLRWFTICTLLFIHPSLSAYQAEGSWCSTPSNACFNACNDPCSHDSCSTCRHWNSSPCEFGCSSRNGVNAGIDFLYWTVYQGNLDYATDVDAGDDPPAILGDGTTHFLEYDWCPGVRAYLGLQICGFGVTGQYTWIKNAATGHKDFTNTTTVLAASMLHPNTGLSNAGMAYGNQDHWFQAADILFSKEIEFCDAKLILRPFLGPRWIKIKQELSLTYEEEDFSSNAEQVRWKSSLNGIGVHVGFDLFYRWVCGFGMYGQLAGTVVGGKADNEHIQTSQDSSYNDINPPNIYVNENQNVCIPGFQLQAGITWDTCCCDSLYIRFRFCYEFNQWLNTPELRRYHYQNEGVSNAATDGSIGLHGGVFGFDIRF